MDFDSFKLTHFEVVIAKLQKKRNQLVATWTAEGRSCPQNHTVRNAWRAPFPDLFGPPYSMFKIYIDSYASGHTCPPDYTVSNVWRASPVRLRQTTPALPPPARPPPHGPTALRLENCPPDLTSTCPRLPPHLLSSIFRRRERHAHEVARRHTAGSGDRENPKQGGASSIPGLPVMTGFP